MRHIKHFMLLAFLGITMLPCTSLVAGFSPQTHFSSDDDCGSHKSREERYEELEISDPTDELEDDTAWPGQRDDYSDLLFR